MRRSPARSVGLSANGSGFTLLELLLSLSLTVIILMLVNMAVDVHLRSLTTRRTQLEESQLARAILRMIADDIRGVVPQFQQDMSGTESLLQQSLSASAGSLAGAAGGGGSTSGGSGGGASAGGTTGTSSGNTGGTSGGGSSGATGGGGTSSGGSSSSGMSATAGGDSGTEPGANTADLATATTLPPQPGLYGNQYQLQLDISRLPRQEDYQRYLTPEAATEIVDVPSDVKTVTYYVKAASADAGDIMAATISDLEDASFNSTGLVRRELDRAITQWATSQGNFTGLENSGDVVAPEVAGIEFQYFDGTQWLLEWDTELQQKLPNAVMVILALSAPGTTVAPDVMLSDLTAEDAPELHLYRTIVYLPMGGQPLDSGADSAGTTTTEEGSSGTESSGSSGSSSSGGAVQAGGVQGGVQGPGGGRGGQGGGPGQGGGRGGGGQGGGPGQGGGRGGGGQGGGQGPNQGGGQGPGGQGGGRGGGR